MSLRRVLVANRGEIAVRIIRACEAEGIETVVAVSEADRNSLAAQMAGRAVCIGPSPSNKSYLKIDTIVAAALGTQCDAVHPGYGFLAENSRLAQRCADYGVRFIGPDADTILEMGDKIRARARAKAAGVPVVPGFDDIADYNSAEAAAREMDLPVLLKAAAGGGGRGMQVVRDFADLRSAFETASAEALAAFGNGTLYIERFIGNARHVEVQVMGDGAGNVVHLGERDCTLQRRHQKVVEEGPATHVPAGVVDRMHKAAVALAQSVGYENAGTVEFIFDQDTGDFFFLEMNTRIQVEHPVTEMLTGVDLVREQLRVAGGQALSVGQDGIRLSGHVIECRINAENAAEDFRPSPGHIRTWRQPSGDTIRVDTHCFAGSDVPPFYDSLLAKLIVGGPDRPTAIRRALDALADFEVEGVDTTIPFLKTLLERPEFGSGAVNTRWVETLMSETDLFDDPKCGAPSCNN